MKYAIYVKTTTSSLSRRMSKIFGPHFSMPSNTSRYKDKLVLMGSAGIDDHMHPW